MYKISEFSAQKPKAKKTQLYTLSLSTAEIAIHTSTFFFVQLHFIMINYFLATAHMFEKFQLLLTFQNRIKRILISFIIRILHMFMCSYVL